MRYEPADHAAEWLGEETRRPRSGVTARTPRPARESLYSFELESSGIRTSLPVAHYDNVDPDDPDTALARLVDHLLEQLSPRQREALELVAIAGLTFGAAAKTMGVSKATLYAHYRDGVARMRTAIETMPWAAAIVGPWLTDDVGTDEDGDIEDHPGLPALDVNHDNAA